MLLFGFLTAPRRKCFMARYVSFDYRRSTSRFSSLYRSPVDATAPMRFGPRMFVAARQVYGLWVPTGSACKTMSPCKGAVSLQDRPEGVILKCYWYEELDHTDVPPHLQASACFSLGGASIDIGA